MKTLIKNVILVDSKNINNLNKVDILIEDCIILKISTTLSDFAQRIVELDGCYVSAGWIDMHTHVFENETDISVNADRIGVESGVVCVCDAGSSGELNIEKLYDMSKNMRTIVKSWINIASTGLTNRHELKDKKNINIEKTIEMIRKYPDFIVGIKLRASSSVMGQDTITPFEKAGLIKREVGKPIMVHFGNFPPTMENIVSYLHKGDVLTHCFHGKPNGILTKEGKIKKIVLEKQSEGLNFDVGHGQESFSYSVAYVAKENKFYPNSISSDLHKYNLESPVSSLAKVVTKFLKLGYSLNEVINMVTLYPANIMNLDGLGKIEINKPARLTIFKILSENKELTDSNGYKINVQEHISMVATIIDDRYEEVKYGC